MSPSGRTAPPEAGSQSLLQTRNSFVADIHGNSLRSRLRRPTPGPFPAMADVERHAGGHLPRRGIRRAGAQARRDSATVLPSSAMRHEHLPREPMCARSPRAANARRRAPLPAQRKLPVGRALRKRDPLSSKRAGFRALRFRKRSGHRVPANRCRICARLPAPSALTAGGGGRLGPGRHAKVSKCAKAHPPTNLSRKSAATLAPA